MPMFTAPLERQAGNPNTSNMSIVNKIKYHLSGGEYGERMNKKSQERMDKWKKEMERVNKPVSRKQFSDFLGTTGKWGKIKISKKTARPFYCHSVCFRNKKIIEKRKS